MLSIYYCLFALTFGAVTARELTFSDDDSPIKEVHTSHGQGNHERVDYIRAVIRPYHINIAGRNNFPRSGTLNTYFQEAMAEGDERGHLVGSQFSGPAEWYNLSPQNARVNRNKGYRSITTEWFGTECEVRRFLDQGGNRNVSWEVTMSYIADSNRPDTYNLRVIFCEGERIVDEIVSNIRNPFIREDSTFFHCRPCYSVRRRRGAAADALFDAQALCEKYNTELIEPQSSNVLAKITTAFLGLVTLALFRSQD